MARLAFLLAVTLTACGGFVDAPAPADPVCFSSTPEAGGDPSLCGVADGGPYSSAGNPAPYIVTECDRPAPNPYSPADNCVGVPYDGARVWCCMPVAVA